MCYMILVAWGGGGGGGGCTIGERHHAFKIVVTVYPAANHPKRQVDLGTPVLNQRRHWRPSPSINRPCRLLFSCPRKPPTKCPRAAHFRSWPRSSATRPVPVSGRGRAPTGTSLPAYGRCANRRRQDGR